MNSSFPPPPGTNFGYLPSDHRKMHSPINYEAASPKMKAHGSLVETYNLDLKAAPLEVNRPLHIRKSLSWTVDGNCNSTCSHRPVNTGRRDQAQADRGSAATTSGANTQDQRGAAGTHGSARESQRCDTDSSNCLIAF